MGAKPCFKPLKTHIDTEIRSSNLSGSTFNELINSKLHVLKDKLLTKSSFDYKLPAINDGGGDIKKQWFVFYSYIDPITKKFKRFKVFEDINTFKTATLRRARAKEICKAYKELLYEGYNPFKLAVHPLLNDCNRTIDNCIDRYLEHINNTTLSRHTQRKYKDQLEIFQAWLARNAISQLDISEIKKQHMREFIDSLKKDRKIFSGKTINDYINNIRTFFNYYIDNYDDYLLRNPASKISTEKVIVKGNIAYSDKEFTAVKKQILETDPYLWLICQVVYYAALRNESEAINIKIGDFDLKNNRIRVGGDISKGRKLQSIPIYPEFKTVLESLNLDQYPENYFLFGKGDQPGLKRVSEDNFAKRFRKIKKELGLGTEYGIYPFKHTRACHLWDDGADLRDIQVLFRHEDLAVTMKYLRSLGRVEKTRELNKGREI